MKNTKIHSNTPTTKNYRSRKTVLIAAVTLLLILVSVGLLLYFRHDINSNRPTVTSEDKTATTTSKEPTAQPSYTGADPKGTATPTTTSPEGTVTDNSGDIDSVPPSSQWTTSSNGRITVYAPATNSVLHNGDTINGVSTADKVGFRLIDSISGVIAQGSITVVNGKFSGTFSFDTKATQGRVDVFEQANNGVESSNVNIPIRLN